MLFALALAAVPQVTMMGLISDGGLEGLSEYPDPPYLTKQFSSYDRASTVAGIDSWFANKDWGNFLRDEPFDGRIEHVMAEAKGPGAIVRYWSPNPAGVTRVYLDGKLVVEDKSDDLLGGRTKDFPAPVGQEASAGWSLYAPLPYQDSMRVTVDNTDGDKAARMYYQIQYRSYAAGTTVEPYVRQGLAELQKTVSAAPAARMSSPGDWTSSDLAPGESLVLNWQGSREIRQLQVAVDPGEKPGRWGDPSEIHNRLRAIRVLGAFDGRLCIDAPLSDFMSTPIGLNRLSSMPASVATNGVMILNLPMPFLRTSSLQFKNTGSAVVKLRAFADIRDHSWTDRSMHFHAQWLCYTGGTRPMRDLSFLSATGKGVFVGCNIGISNPTPDWWGEGDEKMYVDGETFPSTFGTGTEDYFGYGWSNPKLFEHPYHYQSRCDGPGTKGHSCIGRWHILDRLPFTQSFRFDMELWHWADVKMQYSRTAFWYSKPEGSSPVSDDPAQFPTPYIKSGIERIAGAAEAEEAQVMLKTGGEFETQDFTQLSNGKQVWWRDSKPGDKLQLKFATPGPGRYRVLGRFCLASDYGIHGLAIGSIRKRVDFFAPLGWKTLDLGVTQLGDSATLEVMNEGHNAAAEPRNMFGLDYLLFVKEP